MKDKKDPECPRHFILIQPEFQGEIFKIDLNHCHIWDMEDNYLGELESTKVENGIQYKLKSKG